MNSSSKNPLQRQQIATLVKGEVDGLQGIMKKMLANKIGFFEAQQQNIKQNTPGVSSMPSTTHSVTFMNSFKEQVEEIQMELLDAPSNDTVRRVRALLTNAKSNFAKLDSSDIKTALDMLLELSLYTVVDAPRTKTKGAKQSAILNKSLTVSTKGKAGDIRRFVQDILIKGVHQLAGQFLHNADYPRNYEELRDYFDLNERGAAVAKKINQLKADIVVDRERMLDNADDKEEAAAEAEAQKAEAEEMMAEALEAADELRIANVKAELSKAATATYAQLGGDSQASNAMVVFAAREFHKPVVAVYDKIQNSDFDEILHDMKEYSLKHKTPLLSLRNLGTQFMPSMMQEIADGKAVGPTAAQRLLALPLATLMTGLSPAQQATVNTFRKLFSASQKEILNTRRNQVVWAHKYGKAPSTMNQDLLTKTFIIEGLFTDPDNAKVITPADRERYNEQRRAAMRAAIQQAQAVAAQLPQPPRRVGAAAEADAADEAGAAARNGVEVGHAKF
jgi:hypothetical protein